MALPVVSLGETLQGKLELLPTIQGNGDVKNMRTSQQCRKLSMAGEMSCSSASSDASPGERRRMSRMERTSA